MGDGNQSLNQSGYADELLDFFRNDKQAWAPKYLSNKKKGFSNFLKIQEKMLPLKKSSAISKAIQKLY